MRNFNNVSMEPWRKILEARRKVIFSSEASIKRQAFDELSGAGTGEISSIPTHAADLGSDVQEIEMLGTLSERNLKGLHEVEDALDRLNSGRFGFCVECGGQVGEARLAIEPEARYCIDCERKHES